MWNYDDLLADREYWRVEDIPPEIRMLVGDLDCMAGGDGMIDRGAVLYLAEQAVCEWPAPETPEWVQAVIEANPGIWITRLCRAMHGLSETYRSVAYCGQCRSFANIRKRSRAVSLQSEVLPGFEEMGGAYHLHRPCSRRDLTWLRHQIYRLVREGIVDKAREKRPDLRQARGWDYMSVLYPKKKGIHYGEQEDN